jgi:hypothetical protein
MIPLELYRKKYDADHYNCSHFAVDVFGYIFGESLKEDLACFLLPEKERYADKSIRKKFIKIKDTSEYEIGDIVVLHNKQRRTHVAITLENGFIHLSSQGVTMVNWDRLNLFFQRAKVYRHASRSNRLYL